MSKKEKVDIDEEIEKLARKTNVNIKKVEYSYEHQLKNLDKKIDKMVNEKLDNFDKYKETTSDHLTKNYKTDSIDRYREKLKSI